MTQHTESGTTAPSLDRELSDEVRAMIDAAESTAAAIRRRGEARAAEIREEADAGHERLVEHARAAAQAYVEERERRIDELSTPTIEAAEELMQGLADAEGLWQNLETRVRELGADAERLFGPPRPPEPAGEPAQSEEDAGTEPSADAPPPSRRRRFARRHRKGSETNSEFRRARLAALECAVGGGTRDEADELLRASFEVAEADEILDEVFGLAPSRA